jgi:hypothetical protein
MLSKLAPRQPKMLCASSPTTINPRWLLRQQIDDLRLEGVGILILIDQNDAETGPGRLAAISGFSQQQPLPVDEQSRRNPSRSAPALRRLVEGDRRGRIWAVSSSKCG